MFESFRKAPALLQRTLMNFLMLRELQPRSAGIVRQCLLREKLRG